MDPHLGRLLKLIKYQDLKYLKRRIFNVNFCSFRKHRPVPYCLYFGLICLVLMASISQPAASFQMTNKLNLNYQESAPQRPITADVIVLDNGATTEITSLEEYLSQTEKQSEIGTASNEAVHEERLHVNENLTEATTAIINITVDTKAAALFHIEREETTQIPSSSRETEPQQQAEVKHHLDKHHHEGHREHSSTGNSSSKPIPQHWQVRSLLNHTHDYPLTYSRLIYGYIWPMTAAITLFTNLMIVFVLTQRDMRTPTNVVLTAIAIADIIPIVVPVPWFIYIFAMGNEKQVLYPPVACYFYQHSTRSVSEIFYFLSTWLNVLLAVQDYLTACLPHLAKKYCQLRVVVMQIITLTLLAFSLNLPQFLKLVFKPVKFYYNGQLTWGCKAMQAKWFKDLIDGGPAAALITLTALLIRQLQKQRIQGHLLMEQARTASKRRRERHRQQEYESSARVMIFVLLAALAVKIPFATTYTMMIIQSRFEIHFVKNLVDFQTAITITDLAFVLSYPINFTIFCCYSKKFRHKCVQLLGECTHNTKSARNRLMASFSMSLNSSTASQIYKRPSVGTVASQVTGANAVDGISRPAVDKAKSDSEPWLEPYQDVKNSTSSLDDRRPLVLERLCDGQHHLQWLHPGDRPPCFRALLADGSMCHECMARHEDLWASRERRQSADSESNWPMPPPPPPLHIPHYRLPQIVTTRCESIREQNSSDENGEEANEDEEATENERAEAELEHQPEVWHQEDTSSYLASDEDPSYHQPIGYKTLRMTKESQQEHIDRHEQQHDFEEDNAGHLKRPGGQQIGLTSQRESSDQGSTSSFISFKNLKDIVIRRLSGSEERSCQSEYTASETKKDRARHKGTMDDKHSSLSLSNSKLTTLPNATGQLADILMSTLFMPGAGASSRGAFSEPSTHKSPGEHRSRIKDPRRSHG